MKRIISLMAVVILLTGRAFAQITGCGHDSIYMHTKGYRSLYQQFSNTINQWRQHNPDTNFLPNPSSSGGGSGSIYIDPGCPKTKYLVPVVVHIVHATTDAVGVGSNITDAQVANAIDEMNKYFRNEAAYGSPAVNTGIQFCLAKKKPDGSTFSGITRHADNALRNPRFTTDDAALTAIDYISSSKVVNIWVVNSILTASGTSISPYGGYAWHPVGDIEHQGIILRYDLMGNANTCGSCLLDPDSRGGILTHEMGHFLGLFHPWWNGCSGSDTTCYRNGDLCCDVPQIPTQTTSCSTALSSCYSVPTFIQINNMMDYTGEGCRRWFTADQTNVMQATLENYRLNLATPDNVNALGLTCCYNAAWFATNINTLCKGIDTAKIQAYKYTGASYQWVIKLGATTVLTKTDTTSICRFTTTTVGKYSVLLTITSGGNILKQTRNNLIEVIDCGNAIASEQGNWYFGKNAGLKFTTAGAIRDVNPYLNPPNILTGEGTISQSDSLGRLQFYGGGISTDSSGFRIYMKNYKRMPGGPIKGGHGSSSGGAIVIPIHKKWKQYYIITTTGIENYTEGLRYSKVNMLANGGFGAIVEKDSPVIAPTGSQKTSDNALYATEQIAAAPKCKGKGYWVIVGDRSNSTYANYGCFQVYSVDSSGIKQHSKLAGYGGFSGQYKFSPDGTMFSTDLALYNFDTKTGILTFLRSIAINSNSYAVSFSPDSKLLYSKESAAFTYNDSILISQWDLTYPNKPAKDVGYITRNNYLTQMQLGPDNKLYIGTTGLPTINVINFPNKPIDLNVPNTAGFTEDGPLLMSGGIGGISFAGLPNMIDAKKPEILPLDFRVQITNCFNYVFTANTCCKDQYNWKINNSNFTGRIVNYSFTTAGTYTIILIADKDTIIKKLDVGIIKPIITGQDKICDSTNLSFYNAIYSPNRIYKWTVKGGVADVNKNELLVKWHDTGSVKLLINDYAAQCKDSLTLRIRFYPKVNNNVIDSTLLNVCTSNNTVISGTTPTGGTGIFKYQWYISTDKINWQVLTKDTFKNDTLKTYLTQKFYLMRNVVSGNCQLLSNIITLTPHYSNNVIIIKKNICLNGGNVKLTGYGIKSNSSFSYEWQYSTDGSNFTGYSQNAYGCYGAGGCDTTFLNKFQTNINQKTWIRRKIYSYGCVVYSNVIIITPMISIRKQPQNAYVCALLSAGNQNYTFKISMNKTIDSSFNLKWLYYKSSTSSWEPLPFNSTPDSVIIGANGNFAGNLAGSSISVKCRIIGCGDTVYSNTVSMIFTSKIPPTFTKTPTDAYAVNGLNARFVAKSNTGYIQWQKSIDGGTNWADISGQTDSVYIVNVVNYCAGVYQNPFAYIQPQYRAKLYTGCATSYSLHLYAYHASKQAIIRDYPKDFGKEPSDTFFKTGRIIQNPMLSPDIAISYSSSTNPFIVNQMNNFVNPFQGANYIWVRVQNRGTQTSNATTMDLHWSLSSTALKWPSNWTNNVRNRFYNRFTKAYYPMGAKINTSPISVPSIAAGQTTYIMYTWNVANIPTATNYFKMVKNVKFNFYDTSYFPTNQSICLLARMPECGIGSLGMTHPETINTKENCRLNNKIAANNRILSYIKPPLPPPPTGNPRTTSHPIIIRNAKDSIPATIGIKFKANDSMFANIGTVKATLDSMLQQAWVAGGMQGYGFNPISSSLLDITDIANFRLDNITLDTLHEGAIYFDFYLKPVPTGPGSKDYTFDVWQTSNLDTMEEGFTQIILTAPNYIINGGGEGGGQGYQAVPKSDKSDLNKPDLKFDPKFKGMKFGNEKNRNGSDTLNVYPNPTNKTAIVEWSMTLNKPFVLNVYDVLGNVVFTKTIQPNESGQYKETIDLTNQSNGVYNIKVTADGFKGVTKLILIK